MSGGRDVILLKSPVESVISGKERKELSPLLILNPLES